MYGGRILIVIELSKLSTLSYNICTVLTKQLDVKVNCECWIWVSTQEPTNTRTGGSSTADIATTRCEAYELTKLGQEYEVIPEPDPRTWSQHLRRRADARTARIWEHHCPISCTHLVGDSWENGGLVTSWVNQCDWLCVWPNGILTYNLCKLIFLTFNV